MSTLRTQLANIAAIGAFSRVLRWLCAPLLLVAVVSAGHPSKASDTHATLMQFVVDINVIDVGTSDSPGSDSPDLDAFATAASATIAAVAAAPRPAASRASAHFVTHAFAPRAPPVSLHI